MNTKRTVVRATLCILALTLTLSAFSGCLFRWHTDCLHEWGEWQTLTPANCQEGGIEQRVCQKNAKHVEKRAVNPTDHQFLQQTVLSLADCQTVGQALEACVFCHTERTVTLAKRPHEFQDGTCRHCGSPNNHGYLRLFESMGAFRNLTVDLEHLSLEIADLTSPIPFFRLRFSESASLSLSVDTNGKLQGTASGSCEILANGTTAVYTLQGVIEQETASFTLESTKTASGKEIHSVRIPTENLFSVLLEKASISSDTLPLLAQSGNTLLKLFEFAGTVGSDDTADHLLGALLLRLFTEESGENGSRFVLDYQKLFQINRELSNLPASEFFDATFGTGSFDRAVARAEQLFQTKLSDLTLIKEELLEILQLLNTMFPEHFNLSSYDIWVDTDCTVGALLFGTDNYLPKWENFCHAAKSTPLYRLAGAPALPSLVQYVLGQLENTLSFNLNTDQSGALTDLVIEVSDFSLALGTKIALSAKLTVTKTNSFENPLTGLSQQIEELTTPPEKSDAVTDLSTEETVTSKQISFRGKSYTAYGMEFRTERTLHCYSDLVSVETLQKADGTVLMNVTYRAQRQAVTYGVYSLVDENGEIFARILWDPLTETAVECSLTDTTVTLTDRNGITHELPRPASVQAYRELFPIAFGEPEWVTQYTMQKNDTVNR